MRNLYSFSLTLCQKPIPTLISLLLFLSLNPVINAQLTPQDALLLMNRGINVGNSLDAVPTETSWGNTPIKEYYFDDIKSAGFNCVRIPITWKFHVSKSFPYQIDSLWIDRVDTVITWALSKGLVVIINAHHEAGLKAVDTMSNPLARADTLAKYDSIWSQVSRRFKDKPDFLLFEMLNEPQQMSQATLDSLNVRILSIIRKNNPTRITLFSGTSYTGSGNLLATAIPDTSDNYLMAYYHSYDPWSFAGEAVGTFGSSGDISSSDSRFHQVSNWSVSHSIPVTLNECGAVKTCDYNSRMVYFATLVEQAAKYNIAFNFWDDNGNFQLYQRDTRKWDEFKDVIIHTYPKSPTRLSYEISDSLITLHWVNRSTENDGIVVEKLTSGRFDTFTVVGPQADSILLPVLERDVFHYFRLKTNLHDTLMYSYVRRVKIATPSAYQNQNKSVSENLFIYPNPVSDKIIVRMDMLSPEAWLYIFSSDGKLIENHSLTSDEVIIDVAQYRKGIYYIKVIGKGYTANGEFIRN
jgi:aryl-phospho-beta-D-glucosidase BglC (GH1 family)